MQIALIGAEGQVGTFLLRELSGRHQVFGTSLQGQPRLPALDIRDRQAVRNFLENLKPQAVILAAALTHVDQCEEQPELAQAINVQGTEQVAKTCQALNAHLTFFSTDYVFDGKNGPYAEDDPTHPESVYARTKLMGEQIIAAQVKEHLIIRSMMIFSYLPGSANFFMQVLNRAQKGEPLLVPCDQWGNPTQAVNLAQGLSELVEKHATGIFHLSGTTRLTKAEFAQRIVQRLGYDTQLVRPIATSQLKQKAARPLASGLQTHKAEATLKQHALWDLEQALDYTLGQMKEQPKIS